MQYHKKNIKNIKERSQMTSTIFGHFYTPPLSTLLSNTNWRNRGNSSKFQVHILTAMLK